MTSEQFFVFKVGFAYKCSKRAKIDVIRWQPDKAD